MLHPYPAPERRDCDVPISKAEPGAGKSHVARHRLSRASLRFWIEARTTVLEDLDRTICPCVQVAGQGCCPWVSDTLLCTPCPPSSFRACPGWRSAQVLAVLCIDYPRRPTLPHPKGIVSLDSTLTHRGQPRSSGPLNLHQCSDSCILHPKRTPNRSAAFQTMGISLAARGCHPGTRCVGPDQTPKLQSVVIIHIRHEFCVPPSRNFGTIELPPCEAYQHCGP